jgi:hypothetical protein
MFWRIAFELHGERLKGKYTLIQFGKVEKKWLLFGVKNSGT